MTVAPFSNPVTRHRFARKTPARKLPFFTAAFLAVVALCMPVVPARAETPDVKTLLRNISYRRSGWYRLDANVSLAFQTPYGQTASCRGQLTYQRLQEKMMLKCFNNSGRILFVFRTHDMDFDLYLPGRKALYRGNIFDLEHSPDIESHIRPYDLYRALKPQRVSAARARLEAFDGESFSLWIEERYRDQTYAARRLAATVQGDIFSEIYLSPEGSPELMIERRNFREMVPPGGSSGRNPVFPMHITLESPEAGTRTEIRFHELLFDRQPATESWAIMAGEDTRVIDLPELERPPVRPGRYFAAR